MKKKILVIDDMQDVAEAVAAFVTIASKDQACDGEFATNTQQVLSMIGTTQYEAILLDMQDGDIDRIRIANIAREKGIPVLTMSGNPLLRPTLEKPFTMDQLRKALDNVGVK